MIVKRAFKFRLHPSKRQARLLQQTLDECRWLYNQLLEQRKLSYEDLAISLSKYQQLMLLPKMKLERPNLASVHSQVIQNVVDRLDKAFQGFYRRCKAGEKPGFPRFRGFDRYDSFCYPQSGFAVMGQELKLSKIGCIRNEDAPSDQGGNQNLYGSKNGIRPLERNALLRNGSSAFASKKRVGGHRCWN